MKYIIIAQDTSTVQGHYLGCTVGDLKENQILNMTDIAQQDIDND